MVFTAALKVYTGLSSRRNGTDLADAHEKGYLSKKIHPVMVNTFLESDLLTPVLQNLIERVVGPTRPAAPAGFSDEARRIRQIAHAALAKIEDEIERLRFNVCIATIYEFANALGAEVGAIDAAPVADDLRYAFAEAGDILVHCFAPMMPHLAEECWEVLGHASFVAQSPWPVADRSLIVSSEVTYVAQVNGKKRGELTISRDAGAAEIERAALALDGVMRAMDNRPPRKVIIVPNRIVNVVV